jgi:hypothetical protein
VVQRGEAVGVTWGYLADPLSDLAWNLYGSDIRFVIESVTEHLARPADRPTQISAKAAASRPV